MKTENIDQLENHATKIGTYFSCEVVENELDEGENLSFETWLKTEFHPVLAAYRAQPNAETNAKLVEALTDLVDLVTSYSLNNSKVLPESSIANIKKITAFLLLAKGDLLLENLQCIIHANRNKSISKLIKETNANQLHFDACMHISTTEISHNIAIAACPELSAYQKQLVRLEEKIRNRITPTKQMSLEEAEFHIEQKNAGRELYGSTFHGELIHNPDSRSFVLFDPEVIKALINKFTLMSQGKQERTQFIIYPYGLTDGHTLLLDANYNKGTNAFEFIYVDSAQDSTQYRFLKLLIEALKRTHVKYQFIACQTGLQYDDYSCTNFNIALGSIISRLPFDEINKAQKVPQPEFMDSRHISIKQLMADTDTSPLDNVEWVPVTTLGLKAIKLAQSLACMGLMLLKYSNNNLELAAEVKEAWSKQYGVDMGRQLYYMNHRYQSMLNTYNGEPYKDMNFEAVVERTRIDKQETMTPAVALRRLAAGCGPMNALAFLLNHVSSDVVNEQGAKDQRTGLHWALQQSKNHRAYMLLNAGANPNIPDQAGVTAGSMIMNNPKFKALRQYIS